jgi:ankyrin repeat protein
MDSTQDHPSGPTTLSQVAMLRYDTIRRLWRNVPGTAAMARALLATGVPVDGSPADPETPLITAASYGDTAVAKVLLEAGAQLDRTARADAGGVPGGTALLHAAVFGMTDVVDLLVAAGATVGSIEEAAAAGDLTGWLTSETASDAKIRALVMAADHERLEVIDQLLAADTPIEGVDPVFGGHALRTAAANGRPASVGHLLARGADPNLKDENGHTPLDLCRLARDAHEDRTRHQQVEAILTARTA